MQFNQACEPNDSFLTGFEFLQDKYSKFMPTEGLAYESKLAIMLNQQLK